MKLTGLESCLHTENLLIFSASQAFLPFDHRLGY